MNRNMLPPSVLQQSNDKDNSTKKNNKSTNSKILYTSSDNITDSIDNIKILNKESNNNKNNNKLTMDNTYSSKKSKNIKTVIKEKLKKKSNKDEKTKNHHSKRHNLKNIFKKRKNHSHNEESGHIPANDKQIEDFHSGNNSFLLNNKTLMKDESSSKIALPTIQLNNNKISTEDRLLIVSNSSSNDTIIHKENVDQESNSNITEINFTSNNNINTSSLKREELSDSNCQSYPGSILLDSSNSSINNMDVNRKGLLNNLPNTEKTKQNTLQFVNNNLNNNNSNYNNTNNINNNNDSNNSNNSCYRCNNSRRSSITIDSCKTMNNENEIDNTNNDNDINEKDKQNYIYENVTIISTTFGNNNDNNKNISIKNIIDDDDEIALIKKSIKNKDAYLNNNQNIVDLKVVNDILSNNTNNNNSNSNFKDLNKYLILDETDFLNSKTLEDHPNEINLDNVYTVNTAIVNLNKANINTNIESPSSNINSTNDHSNNTNININSSNENNSMDLFNEEKRSHSCNNINILGNSSIDLGKPGDILNSPNLKFGKMGDIVNGNHLKSYNQRHGSYGSHGSLFENKNITNNNSNNSNNNIITKKAIINNALKNNNVGLIYSKRHNSLNNLNKLKLNVNNTMLFQSSSPNSAKSTHSNKSLDESPIASPLLPNIKRKINYKFNDLLLNHRSNSGKKDGINYSLDIHRGIGGNGHLINNNNNNNNANNANYNIINNNNNHANNYNHNNGNNKSPLNFNNNITHEEINFPSHYNVNNDVNNSNVGDIDFNSNNNGNIQNENLYDDNDDVDDDDGDKLSESQFIDERTSTLKDWDFYKQFYKHINLTDLTFKSKVIEQEYDKVINSLDDNYWKNDIPLECSFFCIIDIILNLFNDNLNSTKIQLVTVLIPLLIIFTLIKLFHLNRHTNIINRITVILFTLIGPINYLISFFSRNNNNNNTYLSILFTLNLIIWVFAGHFILHTNYKYTRYSIIICYLLCLIPFYYNLFFLDTKSLINLYDTSSSLLNIHYYPHHHQNNNNINSNNHNNHNNNYNNYTLFNPSYPKNNCSSASCSSVSSTYLFETLNHKKFKYKDYSYSSPDYQANEEVINNIPLKNTKFIAEEQYIDYLLNFKDIHHTTTETIQHEHDHNEILIKEIKDLINRGNSIYLYVDHTLIPLNPSNTDDSLSKLLLPPNLITVTNENSNIIENKTKNTLKNKRNLKIEKIIHDYLSLSLNSLDSSYDHELKNINLSKQNYQYLSSDQKCYDKYELWVVMPESPSQPLKLNNFIIKYFYQKEKEAGAINLKHLSSFSSLNEGNTMTKPIHSNSKSILNEHHHPMGIMNEDRIVEINKSKENLRDIFLFIIKNFVTLESLVYFALIISFYIIIKLKYELDFSLKLQYLTNCQYIQNNSILSLESLQEEDLNRVADFASPIEKAIDIINQLLSQTDKDSKNYDLLLDALDHLNSSNILLPDLERQLQGLVELEDEQKQWLLYEIAQKNYNFNYDESDNSSENSPTTSISSPFAYYELSSFDILSLIDQHTLQLLEKVKDYNFPIFEFCETSPRPLLTMSYHLFVKSGLIGRLHLNTEKFLNFIKEIEEGYHTDVTFHNACHVTDVLHCMYYFTTIPNISVNFKDWDLLFMFVAACIHDYDHPGK